MSNSSSSSSSSQSYSYSDSQSLSSASSQSYSSACSFSSSSGSEETIQVTTTTCPLSCCVDSTGGRGYREVGTQGLPSAVSALMNSIKILSKFPALAPPGDNSAANGGSSSSTSSSVSNQISQNAWEQPSQTGIPSMHRIMSPDFLPRADSGNIHYFRKLPSGGGYEPLFNTQSSLEETSTGWTLHENNGAQYVFDSDFTFLRYIDPGKHETEYTDEGPIAGNPDLTLTRMKTSSSENSTSVQNDVLTTWDHSGPKAVPVNIEHQRTVDGQVEPISRVVNTYYGPGDPYGPEGELQTNTTQVWKDGAWQDLKTYMQRYDSLGRVTHIIHGEEYKELAANVPDPLTASNEEIADYVDEYLEYDQYSRVIKRVVHGGASESTSAYAVSAFMDDVNTWTFKRDETLASGDHKITYTNYAGQPILTVLQDATNPTASRCEFYQYDQNGNRIQHANAVAVLDFDEQTPSLLDRQPDGSFALLSNDQGMITLSAYDAVTGDMTDSSVKEGQNGTETLLQQYEHSSHASLPAGATLPSKQIQYPSTGNPNHQVITQYDYTFHSGTSQLATRTTTLPTVSAAQNGNGSVDTIDEVFDDKGRPTWERDANGSLQYRCYDPVSGKLSKQIDDPDTSLLSNVPYGWQTPSGGGEHAVTDFAYDNQGRLVETLGPVHMAMVGGVQTEIRSAQWTVYNDVENTVTTAQGYAHGAAFDQFELVNPVRITVRNLGDHVVEEISAVRAQTAGKLSASDSFAQSDYVRWTTHQYDECCLVSATRVYHNIPASGPGASGTNYNETKFGYDSAQHQNRVESPGGTISRTVFNAAGNPIKQFVGTNDNGATDSDPTGAGAAGNDMVIISESVFDNGNTDGPGLLTSTTVYVDNSTTRVTNYQYDKRGRQTVVDGELTDYAENVYDNLNRIVQVDRRDTNASGQLISRSETLYDDRGRAYKSIQHGVDPATGNLTGQTLQQLSTFDASGSMIASLAPGASSPVQYEYNARGQQVKVTDQLGNFSTVTYNAAGQATERTDARGKTSKVYFDAVGRQVKTETPLGDTNEVVFDSAGNQVGTIDGMGHQNSLAFDDAGRQVTQTTPEGHVTAFAYDADGNQVSVTDALGGVTQFEYDFQGRQTKVTDPIGSVTQSVYNRASELIESIDAKGNSSYTVYDGLGRQTSMTDRLGGITQFAYTPSGKLASLTDAENQTTSYTFDAFGRAHETIYPDHIAGTSPGDADYGIVTLAYDSQSRLLRKTDQFGDTITYNYDDAGRLISRDYRTAANSPSGTIADTDVFTYDAGGLMLTAVSGRYNNTVTQVHDDSGRMTRQSLTIDGQTYDVYTQYNARGQVSGYTYPDGKQVTRSYHADGALHQVHYDGNLVDTRTYDNLGRMERSTYGNGVITDHAYNVDNTLASITHSGTGSAIGDYSYTWDANKNKLSETITGVMSGYGFDVGSGGYDAEDRLTAWNRDDNNLDQGWNLSPVGDWNSTTENGTVQNRTHGPTHELLTAASQSVTHDAKGNMTLIPAVLRPDGNTLSLVWDQDSKMSSATTNGTTVTQRFDALGRRVARNNDVYVQAGQQTVTDYASGTAPTAPTYSYVYASYIDEPVMRAGGSGDRYFHRNQQYSVVALTDSTGAIKERYSYDAYGTPTITDANGGVLTSSAENNRYTYTGREWDRDLKLYYFRARMYDSISARFSSRDPHEFTNGASLYASYFALSFTDPLGLEVFEAEFGISLYFGFGGGGGAKIRNEGQECCDSLGVKDPIGKKTIEIDGWGEAGIGIGANLTAKIARFGFSGGVEFVPAKLRVEGKAILHNQTCGKYDFKKGQLLFKEHARANSQAKISGQLGSWGSIRAEIGAVMRVGLYLDFAWAPGRLSWESVVCANVGAYAFGEYKVDLGIWTHEDDFDLAENPVIKCKRLGSGTFRF